MKQKMQRLVRDHRSVVGACALAATAYFASETGAAAQSAGTDVFDVIRSYSPRAIIEHDTSQAPGSGGYGMKMTYTPGLWTQGPPSEPQYVDDTWAWGINVGLGGASKADPTKPYAALHWESKFYQGPNDPASPLTEFFLHTIDTQGVAHRPIAWTGRHDGSYGDVFLAGDVVSIANYQHRPRVAFKFGKGDVGGQAELYNGVKFVAYKTAVPVMMQQGASGSGVFALPYIDSRNSIALPRPVVGLQSMAYGANTTVFEGKGPEAAGANMIMSCGSGAATKTGLVGIDGGGNFITRQVSAGGAMFYDYNSSLYWRDKSSGGYSIKMAVQNGKLGVGTLAPTHTLDVAGNVRVGTPSRPTGITLYDTATGAPNCLQITNGVPVSKPGECS